MKLLTEISGNDNDALLVFNGDIDVPGDDQLEHDAAAAHALMRAMDEVPDLTDEMPDEMWEALRNDRDAMTEAFRMAVRETKAETRERADELMRQWGFESNGGELESLEGEE